MAILPIVIAPALVLKQVAQPVAKVDAEIRTLLEDMLDTMYNAHGIGLAANQVGILKRVIVVDVAEREGHDRGEPMKFVNPEIISASAELSSYQEGCLSLPQQYGDVERPAEVHIRYLDENGAAKELHAKGILATCIQHEIDHLDGILFVDHLSKLKREMVLKKLEKAKKRGDFEHIYEPHDHHHHHDHDHVHGPNCNH